jgi:cytochrome c peroxidase
VRSAVLCVGLLAWALGPAGAARAGEAPPTRIAAPEPGSYALPSLGVAADGSVLASDGSEATLHALFADHVVLLSFVYAACSDPEGCPFATAVLHRVARMLAGDAQAALRVRFLSLSFDPERDTPEVMARMAGSVAQAGLDWRFLTTASEAQLAPILEAYGQTRTPERDEEGGETGRFAHVLRVFLIDESGRIRNVYGASFLDAELVVADLRTLLAEQGPPAAAPAAREQPAAPADLLARIRTAPLGLPALPLPAQNPPTREKIALGRKLFFDRRLSENATVSCANCHVPEQGFTQTEQRTSVGIEGRSVRRNAPTLYNAGHLRRLFHDGRANSLEEQVWSPLLEHSEMGNASVDEVLARLRSLPAYAGLVEAAFPERGLTRESVAMAIASYERALVSGDSPFDRWRYGGDPLALDAAAQRGFALFVGRGGCVGCHRVGERSALFTDDDFHDTGVGYAADADERPAVQVALAPGLEAVLDAKTLAQIGDPAPRDLGRFEITHDPADRWRYRTPTLRNVALSAPYMHDGSLATLEEVVAFYDRGGVPNPGLDPRIHPLGLSAQEASDLVAFLRALTGSDVDALLADARAAPIGNVGSDAPGGS